MKAKLLQSTPESLAFMAQLFLSEHIMPRLDMPLRTITGIHYFFSDWESGREVVYQASEDGKAGAVWGTVENDQFEIHIAFPLGFDAISALQAILKVLPDNIKTLVGHIPVNNIPAQRLFNFFGAEVQQTDKPKFWLDSDGNKIECVKMIKEL